MRCTQGAPVNPASNVPCDWPNLSVGQQQEFQQWYASRARQRADVIEKALHRELDLAELAQERGDLTGSRQHQARARDLKESGASLGSMEDLRREAWKFAEHPRQ